MNLIIASVQIAARRGGLCVVHGHRSYIHADMDPFLGREATDRDRGRQQ